MNKVTTTPLRRPLSLPDQECRTAVEAAMLALIDALVEKGMMRPAVALALADASEDLAIRLVRNLPANTNKRRQNQRP
ncbi:MAG: hypothetical protein PW791_16365 [Neorhizobium sp.]|jgi:hypothetical protein|nr:hypothetical protein [Neorhizobium sp.]